MAADRRWVRDRAEEKCHARPESCAPKIRDSQQQAHLRRDWKGKGKDDWRISSGVYKEKRKSSGNHPFVSSRQRPLQVQVPACSVPTNGRMRSFEFRFPILILSFPMISIASSSIPFRPIDTGYSLEDTRNETTTIRLVQEVRVFSVTSRSWKVCCVMQM